MNQLAFVHRSFNIFAFFNETYCAFCNKHLTLERFRSVHCKAQTVKYIVTVPFAYCTVRCQVSRAVKGLIKIMRKNIVCILFLWTGIYFLYIFLSLKTLTNKSLSFNKTAFRICINCTIKLIIDANKKTNQVCLEW